MSEALYHSFRFTGVPGEPLVIAFHGTGGDEHQFVDLIRQMLPKASIVAPRGDVAEYGANRFFRRMGEGVYDMDDLAMRTDKMTRFIERTRETYPGSNVYGLGYSNGANILASVLFRQPRLFDRAALLHPLIPWSPEPHAGLMGKPVFVSAGLNDPICPLPQSRALIDWLAQQRADVDAAIVPGGHEISPGELRALQRFMTAPAPVTMEAG